MKSTLQQISTLNMSHQDWLNYRFNGIGGSEISAILGLNPYFSSHKLFYLKLGEIDYDPENIHMFWGKQHEDKIAEIWEYHDPNNPAMEITMQNYNEGKIIRKCRRVNAYIINPEYPHLFASLDRVINKGDNKKEGILECKTISAFAAKVWEIEIPPMHVAQLQFYLLQADLEYGELATLKDGKYFEVLPFERNEEFIRLIIESSKDFWDRVTRARILKQDGKPYEQLEPEIDNQEAYKSFLSERYKAEPKKIKPELFYYELGTQYLGLNEEIKSLETKQDEIANQIKAYMKESDTMNFGASGTITWKQNKTSMKFNTEGFKEQHPELYDKYIIETPGSRTFKVNLKQEKTKSKAA